MLCPKAKHAGHAFTTLATCNPRRMGIATPAPEPGVDASAALSQALAASGTAAGGSSGTAAGSGVGGSLAGGLASGGSGFDVDAAQAALSAAVRSEQASPGESRPLRFTPLTS